MSENFLSCAAFGSASGYHRQRINDFCLDNPGFGIQCGPRGWWKIPAQHLERLRRGETVASIAANPSMPPSLGSPKAHRRAHKPIEAADAP